MNSAIRLRTILTAAFLLAAAVATYGQTRVQGAVQGRWSSDGSPFIAEQTIWVPDGRMLTIEPGVEVRLAAGVRFYVYGRLLAAGSEDDNIRFIRDGDDAWGGLRFVNPDEAQQLTYCHISGGAALRGGEPADTVSSGGNIFLHHGRLEMSNCSVIGGQSQGFGGGVAIWGGSLTMYRCILSANQSATQGGGLNVNSNSSAAIDNCRFIANSAGWGGGGMNIENGSTAEVHNSLFQSNRAISGGGLSLYGRSVEVRNTTFLENHGGMGGGAYVRNEDNRALFEWCDFIDNRADADEGVGGAMMVRFFIDLAITYCRFNGNQANWGGGAIWFQGRQRARFNHNLFFANRAGRTGGAIGMGENNGDQPVVITASTFLENRAEAGEHPAQIAHNPRGSSIIFNSCILWGPEPFFTDNNQASVIFSHTSENIPGQGNRRENPRIFEMDSTWALPRGDAPTIDSGDPNLPRDLDNTLPDRGWVHFPRNGWDGLETAEIIQSQPVGERHERTVRFTNRSGVPVFATATDKWREEGRELMFNLTNLIGDREISCAAWTDVGFLIGGGNSGADPNRMYVLDRNLNLIRQFPQPGGVGGEGFLDLAYIGEGVLYAGDDEQIVEFTSGGELGDQFEGPDAVRTFRGIAYEERYAIEDIEFWLGGDEGFVVRTDWDFWEQERIEVGDTIRGLASKGNMRALYTIQQKGPLAMLVLILPDEERVTPLYPLLPPVEGARIGGLDITFDWRAGRGSLVGIWKGSGDTPDYLFVSDLFAGWLAVIPQWRLLRPGDSADWRIIFAGDVVDRGRFESPLYLSLNDFGGGGEMRAVLVAGEQSAPLAPALPNGFGYVEAWPNPFNGILKMNFAVSRTANLEFQIMDITGRTAAKLPLGTVQPGVRTATFNAGRLPAGMYIIQINADGSGAFQRKVALVR